MKITQRSRKRFLRMKRKEWSFEGKMEIKKDLAFMYVIKTFYI